MPRVSFALLVYDYFEAPLMPCLYKITKMEPFATYDPGIISNFAFFNDTLEEMPQLVAFSLRNDSWKRLKVKM